MSDQITPGERRELRAVVRQQMKVLRTEVEQRKYELVAEAEHRLAEKYRDEDRAADELHRRLAALTEGVNRELLDVLQEYENLINGNRTNAARRPVDQPSPTVMFSRRSNKVEWAYERPAATVSGGGQSVRVTVEEAAILQGFPPDYPWRGTKTQRYRQVGDCVPPPVAAAILRPLLAAGRERAA